MDVLDTHGTQQGRAGLAVADGFVTYASFAADPAHRLKGGWRIGQQDGIGRAEATALIATAPTHLASETPVPRYVGEKERGALIHRGVWANSPWDNSTQVFTHSTPAGNDASGRPANVFSTMYTFGPKNQLAVHPVTFLGSESVLVPFNAEVNKQRVESREIVVNAELTPRLAFERLMRHTRRGFVAIRDVVATIIDCLATSSSVVIACESTQAADWLTLVTLATDPTSARQLSFSTYERAASLLRAKRPEHLLTIVPPGDLEALRNSDFGGAAVIDAAGGVNRGRWEENPSTYGFSGDDEVEVSAASALYEHLVTSPAAADVLLENPAGAEALADKLALLCLRAKPVDLDAIGEPLRRVVGRAREGSAVAAFAELSREDSPEPRRPTPVGETDARFEASTSSVLHWSSADLRNASHELNPFDVAPASEPEPEPAMVQVSVRYVDERQQQRLLDSLVADGPGVVADGVVRWSQMTEFLLASPPPGSPAEHFQVEIFAAAAVRRLNSTSESTQMLPQLPYWRLFSAEHPQLLRRTLDRTTELIDVTSRQSPQERERLYQVARELGATWRDMNSPNVEFAKFLSRLDNSSTTPPHTSRKV